MQAQSEINFDVLFVNESTIRETLHGFKSTILFLLEVSRNVSKLHWPETRKRKRMTKKRGIATIRETAAEIPKEIEKHEIEITKLEDVASFVSIKSMPYNALMIIMAYLPDVGSKHNLGIMNRMLRRVFFECSHPGLEVYVFPFIKKFRESSFDHNDEIFIPIMRFMGERATHCKRFLIGRCHLYTDIFPSGKAQVIYPNGTIAEMKFPGKVYSSKKVKKAFRDKNSFFAIYGHSKCCYEDPEEDDKTIYIETELIVKQTEENLYLVSKPIGHDFLIVHSQDSPKKSAIERFFEITGYHHTGEGFDNFNRVFYDCISTGNRTFIETFFRNEVIYGENFFESNKFIELFQDFLRSEDNVDRLKKFRFLHEYARGRYTNNESNKKARALWN